MFGPPPMYVWILTVTYLYGNLTGNTVLVASYPTRPLCEIAANYAGSDEKRIVAECRAVRVVGDAP
jgi:hypothetical protein